MNLLSNAREAMPGGGVIEVSTALDKEFLRLSFKDSGIGIPEAIKGRLFEPFITTKESGTGLGLAICQEIVTSHGGSIKADSAKGKGSIFTILLPIERASHA